MVINSKKRFFVSVGVLLWVICVDFTVHAMSAHDIVTERLARVHAAAKADKNNAELQLRNVIMFRNAVMKSEGQIIFLADFPRVFRRLEERGITPTVFFMQLLCDVAESLDETLKFKMAQAPGGNLRDHSFYEYLTTQIGRQHHPILYWCECKNASIETRFRFVFTVLERILSQCSDLNVPVSYTDIGEEGCLQSCLVTRGLALLGCPLIHINVINRPEVVVEKAISVKIDAICAKFTTEACRVEGLCFRSIDMRLAVDAVRGQPGLHVFAAVDLQDDSNETVDLADANGLSFGISFNPGMTRRYFVGIGISRCGLCSVDVRPCPAMPCVPMVLPEPILLNMFLGEHPEMLEVFNTDMMNIYGQMKRHLATKPAVEWLRSLTSIAGRSVFCEPFKDFAVENRGHLLTFLQVHNCSYILDELADLVKAVSPDGSGIVLILNQQKIASYNLHEDRLIALGEDIV